jgi:hypothetical protein
MRRRIIKINLPKAVDVHANRPKIITRVNSIIQPNVVPSTADNALTETTTFLKRKSNKVFIIGGGASLINLNLDFIKNEDVICVNKAIDLIKNPKYFITMDYTFFKKDGVSIQETVNKAQSSHFVINKTHSYITKHNNVYTDTKNNIKYIGLEHFSSIIDSTKEITDISGFCETFEKFSHGNNSGYCAVQFAILAGYTEIYLLGFDLNKVLSNSKTHFHNSYPAYSLNIFNQNIDIYKKNLIGSITRIKRFLPINFYTITPSALEPIVVRVKPENINANIIVNAPHIYSSIDSTDLSNLMVVGYYTVNTPYENEAEKLTKSLDKLKLNYDVIGVANLGNWQANTRFKAKFMEDMLNKHLTKNLLYVDVDAIVHSRPILFENYNCDIAVRWQDFKWRKNECLSGTIFMANTGTMRELCQRWQKINIKEGPNATTFEQWNLGNIIKEMENEKLIISKNLPPEYTMIFDSMKSIYPNVVPVIEHFQASRRLKNKVNNGQ